MAAGPVPRSRKPLGAVSVVSEPPGSSAAWIVKEKLRDVLNLRARVTGSAPCVRDVRGRLATFYDWCAQHTDIGELVTLARTVCGLECQQGVPRWDDERSCHPAMVG